jgi:hypothetical protein
LPRCARALRRGALEILVSPWKGAYISRIKKIAATTASEHRNKASYNYGIARFEEAEASENNG